MQSRGHDIKGNGSFKHRCAQEVGLFRKLNQYHSHATSKNTKKSIQSLCIYINV